MFISEYFDRAVFKTFSLAARPRFEIYTTKLVAIENNEIFYQHYGSRQSKWLKRNLPLYFQIILRTIYQYMVDRPNTAGTNFWHLHEKWAFILEIYNIRNNSPEIVMYFSVTCSTLVVVISHFSWNNDQRACVLLKACFLAHKASTASNLHPLGYHLQFHDLRSSGEDATEIILLKH